MVRLATSASVERTVSMGYPPYSNHLAGLELIVILVSRSMKARLQGLVRLNGMSSLALLSYESTP